MSSQNREADNPVDTLSCRMRRFWPPYCLVAALVTFGYALYDPYQIDGDAVSYMDIADLIRHHQWAGVINGYWNPLYPAMLALGRTLFHSTRFTELHAYYLVNFAIFLLGMFAVISFTDALVSLRNQYSSADSPSIAPFLLDSYALRYLGISLLVISAQRELSMGKVRPDALLQALLLLAVSALLRHLATARLRYAALLGFALGFAYLAKSFAFFFALLCFIVLIVFRLLWQKHVLPRVTAAALLAIACFSIVAGPYIALLSRQKGRMDFGDSGNLNYAWFVSGTARMHLQPEINSSFGAAEVHLQHPEEQLLQTPAVFSYKQLPYGTYPDWFDPSFWNERIKPHMNPHLQIAVVRDCVLRFLRYLSNHPEPWLLLIMLLLLGARFKPVWRPSANSFWLPPALLGLTTLFSYGLVHIEDRYIAFGVLILLLSVFAALRLSRSAQSTATSAVILLVALLSLGESAREVGELRRSLVKTHSSAGWYDPDIFGAAHALNDLGVGPGNAIACIGARACLYDHYWARLAGVRILTEIYEPATPLYPNLAAMPNRDEAIDIVRRQGGKVMVGYFPPGLITGINPVSAGWRELGITPFYALTLNLPATATAENTCP